MSLDFCKNVKIFSKHTVVMAQTSTGELEPPHCKSPEPTFLRNLEITKPRREAAEIFLETTKPRREAAEIF